MPHIPQVQPPPSSQQPHTSLNHTPQILFARQVLHHRVHHDRVEISFRQTLHLLGRLHPQAHTIPDLLRLFHLRSQALYRLPREVRAPVLLHLGRDLPQQQPRAHADLQHPFRLQLLNPPHRLPQPLPHLSQLDRLPAIAAVPATEILSCRSCFPSFLSVQRLIGAGPFLHLLLFPLPTCPAPPAQHYIPHQLLLASS